MKKLLLLLSAGSMIISASISLEPESHLKNLLTATLKFLENPTNTIKITLVKQPKEIQYTVSNLAKDSEVKKIEMVENLENKKKSYIRIFTIKNCNSSFTDISCNLQEGKNKIRQIIKKIKELATKKNNLIILNKI